MLQSIQRLKRFSKKPIRYKTTSSSEEKVKAKKPKLIDEGKTKKKVLAILQDIHNSINNENVPCTSNFKKKSTCTKVRIIFDETIQNTPYIQAEERHNQKHNLLPCDTTPFIEQSVSNNGQNTTNNFAESTQRQSVNNFHSLNMSDTTTILSQQLSSENSFHRVTHESNKNLMKNNIQHKRVLENVIPSTIHPHNIVSLENEMQLLHNVQSSFSRHQQSFSNVALANTNPSMEESNYCIQELGNTVPVTTSQTYTQAYQRQLENNNNDNIALPNERKDMEQVIELLTDLQHEMQGTNERLDSIEQKIDSNIINTIPTKPRILPFSTVQAIKIFTKDNAVYDEVVCYFKFLNCITLKNSVHQCVKEALTTQVAEQLTWWGVNDIKFPFYNTFLCQAIYQSVASNRYYPKPTREEFQRKVVASLKVAKQRFRNARGRHPGIQGSRRNLQATALYNDEDVDNHGDNGNQTQNEHNNNAEDVENNNDDTDEHSSN